MELKVQNFDRFVQETRKRIICSATNFESLLKSYDFAEKSKTDRQNDKNYSCRAADLQLSFSYSWIR